MPPPGMGINWRIKEPNADPLPQCTLSTAACLQAQKFGREDKDASQSSQEELQSKQSGGSERYCVGGGPWELWDGVDLGPEFLPLAYMPQCAPVTNSLDGLAEFVCVHVCACAHMHRQTKTEVGGTAAVFGGTLWPQHHCGARALSSSLNWMQPRVSLVMGQGWIVC